ncbi:MAG: 30S ribosomal protein S20 [Endomicrobium sp.]|jgi:small subunit ribosomal protein S20|nr:30S ribosomal protein S20 [Endomicrobium sp.]
MAKLKTGRHTSALKEARKTKKRTLKNKSVKSQIKTSVKRVEDAVKKNDAALAAQHLNAAFSQWDRAAKRNIIHKNAASNQKERLAKKVASILKTK